MILQAALEEGRLNGSTLAIITEDLRKCYDSLHIGITLTTAAMLGANFSILNLVGRFYAQSRRVFRLRGHISSSWHVVRHGLVQGCPFSVVLLGFMMSVWAWAMRRIGVATSVFLDDRAWWQFAGPMGWRPMLRARAITRAFDDIYGLTINVDKCRLSFAGDVDQNLVAEIGYIVDLDFVDLLGVRLSLRCAEQNQYRRYDRDQLIQCLRSIGVATRRIEWRRMLVRTMGFAKFVWAAGVVRLPDHDLQLIGGLALRALLRSWPRAAAHVMLWAMAGWSLHPEVAHDIAVLRAYVRLLRERDISPHWYEDVPLMYSCGSPDTLLPQLRPSLRRLGWRVDLAHGELYLNGDCPWRAGYDSFVIVQRNVEDRMARSAFRSSRAFRTTYIPRHDRAHGLSLPAPAVEESLYLKVHRDWFFNPVHPFLERRALAIGAGLDFWYWSKRGRGSEEAARCGCGDSQPSASHLLWCCPARPPDMCRRPRNRAEDRLWCPTLAPEPPPACWVEDTVEARRRLRCIMQHCDDMQLATDGGSKDGWAGRWPCTMVGAFVLWQPQLRALMQHLIWQKFRLSSKWPVLVWLYATAADGRSGLTIRVRSGLLIRGFPPESTGSGWRTSKTGGYESLQDSSGYRLMAGTRSGTQVALTTWVERMLVCLMMRPIWHALKRCRKSGAGTLRGPTGFMNGRSPTSGHSRCWCRPLVAKMPCERGAEALTILGLLIFDLRI
mmetsp:Transcript_59466/g.193953  ORF Transcript_59466/g.193953 Transcript_59466/m.193953 type:complete len:722 (+) Transcript_59466:2334-4499(+)